MMTSSSSTLKRDVITGIPLSWLAVRVEQILARPPAISRMKAELQARRELLTTSTRPASSWPAPN